MTTANVNITKVLLKRGNTTQNDNYRGVFGEVTVDTEAKTLRIHDGTTVGGTTVSGGGGGGSGPDTVLRANVGAYQIYANANAASQATSINSINANLGAFQIYANNTFGVGTYSNTNVAAYLSGQNITSANIGGSQAFANANAASQATSINSINANIGAYQIWSNANAAAQTTSINSINANIGAYQTYANANASSQTTEINSLRSNITAANTRIANLLSISSNVLPAANVTYSLGSANFQWRDLWVSNNTIYIGNVPLSVSGNTLLVNGQEIAPTANINAVTVEWTANAGSQQTQINSLQANVTAANATIATLQTQTYSNVNTAAYLAGAVTVGNVTAGNLTVETNAVVLGNLRVVGTQTTVNAATLSVNDLYVTVANGAIQSSDANGAGLRVAGALANIAYSSVTDSFEFNKPISVDTLTASSALKTNLINNLSPGQRITIDPDNSNAAYFRVDGFDDGGERVVISNQFPNGAGIYFYTENSTFRMSGNQFKFADDTWQNTAWTGTVANLTLGSNVVALLSNGNLLLPNNMIFTTSPAVSTTGIVFGDGKFQNTAYTGPDSVLVNGGYNATLDTTGNLVVPGSILPSTDIAFDLGSPDLRFRHLYVGPGTVYVGNAAIKTTVSGNLILPGITRPVASTSYAEEVEDTGDQSYSFTTTPTLIDNAHYSFLNGNPNNLSFTPATYSSTGIDGDGYVRNISIDTPGAGYADQVEQLAQENMWATEAADPLNNFNAGDWTQIPFSVRSRAGESEYEFSTGGGTDTGDITFDGQNISSTSNVVNISASDYAQLQSNNNYIWVDNQGAHIEVNEGGVFDFERVGGVTRLKLPADGDIVDSTGTSVLSGGGANLGNLNITDSTIESDNSNNFVNMDVNNADWMRLGTYNNQKLQLITDYNGDRNIWEFAANGVLTLPVGGDILNSNGTSVLGGGGNANTGNVVFDGDQLYVGGTGFLDLRNNDNQVELGSNNVGPVIVSTDEGTNRWEFGADGALTLPGPITVDTTYNSLVAEFDGGNGEYYLIISKTEWPTANVEIQAGDIITKATDPATSLVVTGAVIDDGVYWLAPTGDNYIAGGTMSFRLSRPKPEWQFNANSTITFPDNTVQTTAYVPYVPVAPVVQDNLMLDGGGAATIYEVTVNYAEGGFSATRYGVNTPSFDGGAAALEEAIYYTLDGGGA